MVVLTLHSNTNPVVCNFAEPLYGATHVRLSSALLYDNELTVRKSDGRLFTRFATALIHERTTVVYKPWWQGGGVKSRTTYWRVYHVYEHPPMVISPGYYTAGSLRDAIRAKETESGDGSRRKFRALLKFEAGHDGSTHQMHSDFDTTITPDSRLPGTVDNDERFMAVRTDDNYRAGNIRPSERFKYLFWGHAPTKRSTFTFNKLRREKEFFVHCDMVDERQQILADRMSDSLAVLSWDKGMRMKHYTPANAQLPWRPVRSKKGPHTGLQISVRNRDGDLLDFHGEFLTFVVEIK